MNLSSAVEGFLLHKGIEGLSERTLETYSHQLGLLTDFLKDPDIKTIKSEGLRLFFDYLRHEYVPTRWNGDQAPLSSRSMRNHWVACRSLWTWLEAEFMVADAMKVIPAPKPNTAHTIALNEKELKAIMLAAGRLSDGRRHPHSHRNQAILLILLDTGIRASELCSLTIGDLNLKVGRLMVDGKGDKKRSVYLGERTRKTLWRYLTTRNDADIPDAPLFLSGYNRPISRGWLRRIIADTGKRAGVPNVYPHRFRHTFAIQYLRNGGDIFTLQVLLGHSSLKMVRYYAAVADVDAERVHRRASPVDNWAI